jgi:uncharacterized surface protein with fasciclin (FAS1) repeats
MVRRLAFGMVVMAALLSGCTGSETTGVTGPLCDLLPTGDDPGNPASLTGEPADQALQWIPVLTTFEAAARASGLLPELTAKPGITVLAPTDDAFAAKFSETNLDNLMLKDKDSLRTLVRAHVVDRPLSLAELRDGGEVTTMDGAMVRVAAAGPMARIGGEAQTVCADYRMANGRIHVINHVLGNLPTTAGQDGDEDH